MKDVTVRLYSFAGGKLFLPGTLCYVKRVFLA